MVDINRKSIEVKQNQKRQEARVFVTVTERGRCVFFTSGAAYLCGIEEGSFTHFMNEGADWLFYFNDNKDGFPVSKVIGSRGVLPCYRVHSTGLVNMILKSVGHKKQKRFSIEKTAMYNDKCPVFKLSLENVSTTAK